MLTLNEQGLATRYEWEAKGLFGVGSESFVDIGPIDGGPIVLHRDGVEAHAGPLLVEGVVFAAAEIAGAVIGDDHEGRGGMGVIGDGVDVHRLVAAGVAKGEDGLLADFLGDGADFVELEVLDEQFVAAEEFVLGAILVTDPILVPLVGGH